jgi:hypothetical protein
MQDRPGRSNVGNCICNIWLDDDGYDDDYDDDYDDGELKITRTPFLSRKSVSLLRVFRHRGRAFVKFNWFKLCLIIVVKNLMESQMKSIKVCGLELNCFKVRVAHKLYVLYFTLIKI